MKENENEEGKITIEDVYQSVQSQTQYDQANVGSSFGSNEEADQKIGECIEFWK